MECEGGSAVRPGLRGDPGHGVVAVEPAALEEGPVALAVTRGARILSNDVVTKGEPKISEVLSA